MTPEQRATKNLRDRERRERIKLAAQGISKPVPVTPTAAKSVPVARQAVKPAAAPKAKRVPELRQDGDERMIVISFRGTQAQKDKLQRLGGGEWARARIDAATVKPGR